MAELSKSCRVALEKLTNALNMVVPVDDPIHKARFIRNAMGKIGAPKPSVMDKAVSYSINSMLSGLATPVANALSVAYKAFQVPINDIIETGIRRARGEDVAFTDVLHGYKSAIENFKAATFMMKAGFKDGYPLDYNATISDIAVRLNISDKAARQKVVDMIMDVKATELARARGIKPTEARAILTDEGVGVTDDELAAFVNDSYDVMRNVFDGPITQYINVPTKVTVAIDEFGKSLFRTYKIGQMASKKARQEAKAGNGDYEELYQSYMKKFMSDAAEGDAKEVLRKLEAEMGKAFGLGPQDLQPFESVKEYALREMFQERLTGLPLQAHETIKKHPTMRLFVPFMKTPWNISKEAFSYFPALPALAKKTLGPAMKRGTDIPDLTKRGAYYDLSWEQMAARQMIGFTAFAGIMSMFDSDSITGVAKDANERQAWRDAGKPERAIKVGDTWYEYGRIEPVATVMQMAAELRRLVDDYDNDPNPDKEFELKQVMFAFKASVMDKTFMKNFHDMMGAAVEGDVGKAGLVAARQATPALGAQAARLLDDKERQATTFAEKIQQRIPLLRNQLPEEYGLYGSAREGDVLKEVTGIGVSSESDRTPLQKAITDLGVTKVRPSDKLRGVALNNEQLSEYRKEVATFLTPRLEKFVQGGAFQNLPKAKQKVVLEKVVNKLKRQAMKQFAYKLRRTDPEAARKLYNVEMLKLGNVDNLREGN
jgi:hypothetical protein